MFNTSEKRIAVLVDCDNVQPEILEHSLTIAAQFGRVTMRKGYGNHATLANKWQDALVRLAFTPSLQYTYASGKNTSDIALGLDAVEAFFDQRVDAFCLVTSDSDFVQLCKKLRERGAMVYIVGEEKTPTALRNTCDQFFAWVKPDAKVVVNAEFDPQSKSEASKTTSPDFVVTAVEIMSAQNEEGRVGLGALGQFLKRTDPAFTSKSFGHAGLLSLVKSDSRLFVFSKDGGSYVSVRSAVTQKIKEPLDEQPQ
jgi:uncharacterized protein (TIGR00288 family)